MRDKKRQQDPAADPPSSHASAAQVESGEWVRLQKDHTHAGVKYVAGDRIRVSALDRDWLREQSVIES